MATVTIKIESDGTELEIVESSLIRSMTALDLDQVPALLGTAVKRAVHAATADGDRQNALTAVAERMGVHVDYID
ncbi:hypothetical protein ACIBCR_14995 [Micromonospora echinospora]|uniref:hypothetical protein n=1 Tax=Micromonospora echinospora TaxID=1877 RepID=UPI0037982DFA